MGTRFIAMRSPKSGIPGCGRILRDQGHAERFEPLLENVDDGSLRVVCGYWPRAGANHVARLRGHHAPGFPQP